jgi:hypothetical protein
MHEHCFPELQPPVETKARRQEWLRHPGAMGQLKSAAKIRPRGQPSSPIGRSHGVLKKEAIAAANFLVPRIETVLLCTQQEPCGGA